MLCGRGHVIKEAKRTTRAKPRTMRKKRHTTAQEGSVNAYKGGQREGGTMGMGQGMAKRGGGEGSYRSLTGIMIGCDVHFFCKKALNDGNNGTIFH